MSRRLLLTSVFIAILVFSLVGTAQASPEKLSVSQCTTFLAQTGNPYSPTYMICMPEAVPWNGQLVVFAHGYVPDVISKYPVLPLDQIVIDGISLSETLNSMGFAFAMTSYPTNGLAILPGVQDVLDLVETFKRDNPGTLKVFLTGASEGGLVTTLALEQNPTVFAGGLAVCGPIGNFQNQVNHFGDFRVLFDYFFPNVLPVGGPQNYSAINIPDWLMADWFSNPTKYQGLIATAFTNNPGAVKELFQVAKVPVDASNPQNFVATAFELLGYNVLATMDARIKLSVNPAEKLLNPFGNTNRVYWGSSNDFLLNKKVARFSGTVPNSIMSQYQTSGRLASPLVTMHTTGDPTVPYSHESLYTLKTLQTGSFFKRVNIPIARYGHCAFQAKEVIFGFSLMVLKATGTLPLSLLTALPDGGPAPILTAEEFYQMQKDFEPKQVYIPMVGK